MLLEANPGAARHLANGQTPLHYACCHQCDPRVAKLLIDRYPRPAASTDGNAPLHFALIRSAHPAVVQLLVKTPARWRGGVVFLGRLPLSLALLYEAHPAAIKAVRDAYPDAHRNEEMVADYRNHGKLADYARCAKCEPRPPPPSETPARRASFEYARADGVQDARRAPRPYGAPTFSRSSKTRTDKA